MSIVIGEVICIWRFLNTAADRINTGKDSMNKIEDIQQSYFAFLDKKNAKDAVGKIIADGIEKWKKCDAYAYEPVEFQPNDFSGRVVEIEGKTIGDIAKTEIDILWSHTGESLAAHMSHYGLDFPTVAEDISNDINQYLNSLLCEFVLQNEEALLEYYKYTIEHNLLKGVGFKKKDFVSEEELHNDWMWENFTKYMSEDCFDDVI